MVDQISETTGENVFQKSNLTFEISDYKSPYWQASQFAPYNPDLLYQKKGNLDIYDEMRDDDQVKSVLLLKKFMCLNSGYDFVIEGESKFYSPEQVELIKKFLTSCFNEDIESSFEESLYEILSALDYGYSVTEKIFKLDKGQWKIKYLKTRYPNTFEFRTDDKGNLGEKGLVQHTQTRGNQCLPEDKFIIFTYQAEFGNIYGTPDLRAAYKPWWAKNFIIKCWNIYLERFGMPTIIAKYDSNSATETDQANLATILKNVQAKTSMVLPDSLQVELLQSTKTGEADYGSAIDRYNMQIARSLLVPDLMGMGGAETGGGSYSLGEKQFEMFLMILKRIRSTLERKINLELVKPLMDLNFGARKGYPVKFKFNDINDDLKYKNLTAWKDVVQGAKLKPTDEEVNWARRIVGAPEGEVKFQESPKPLFSKDQPFKSFAQDVKVRKQVMAEFKIKDPVAVKTKIESILKNSINELSKQIRVIGEGLIETVTKGKIIENNRVDKIKDLTLKYTGPLRMTAKDTLKDMFIYGTKQAQSDLGRVPEEYQAKVKTFSDLDQDAILEEVIGQMSVFISDSITDDILKKAKAVLSDGIKAGYSLQKVTGQLRQILEPYDTRFDAPLLNTIVRTNYMNIYNQSKMAFYKPFQENGFIQAYQYSAIMDDRVSDFCEEMNGLIFRAGEVGDIEPPNHFNCRSTLIPITIDEIEEKEIFGATDSENEEVFPDGKFTPDTMPSGFVSVPGGFWKEE